MTVSSALRDVAGVIDELGNDGIEVVDAEADELIEDGAVSIRLTASVPFGAPQTDGISATLVDATVDGDAVLVELAVSAACEGGEDANGGRADEGDARSANGEGVEHVEESDDRSASDPDAAHRDPERLMEAYEEHDTFAEMTDALGTDVAPNTVRRQMVKHGIHDPDAGDGDRGAGDADTSDATGGGTDSDGETEDAVAETDRTVAEGHAEPRGDPDATDAAEEGTPVHRDPERLREAYEGHDSFAEMTDALGTDVTPQTVRRNMIEHGIHEPRSNASDRGADGAESAGSAGVVDTGDPKGAGGSADSAEPVGSSDSGRASGPDDDDDGESEDGDAAQDGGGTGTDAGTTLADGIDLPDGITLDEVKEIVLRARTVHEVRRELGVGRERARRLLSELGLLDLVAKRLADDGKPDGSLDEIDRRIREASPDGA